MLASLSPARGRVAPRPGTVAGAWQDGAAGGWQDGRVPAGPGAARGRRAMGQSMKDAMMMAETISITGHGGDQIEAYLARPLGPGPHGGVVVIHHMPGYDAATKEITRTFAAHGYLAICPNLHYRDAPGASPDDAAAAARARGGVPDDRLVGDVGGAAEFLRSMPASNGRAGTIGYCSGGR